MECKIPVKYKLLLLPILCIQLFGCGSTPKPAQVLSFNNGVGLINAQNPMSAKFGANKFCMNMPNGLGIRDIQPKNIFYTFEYSFTCYYTLPDTSLGNIQTPPGNPKSTLSLSNSEPPPSSRSEHDSSLDSAKQKCAELGLKSGTEKYGQCVLIMSK